MWYNQINKRFVKIIRFDNEEDVTVIDESNLNLSPSLSFFFFFLEMIYTEDIGDGERRSGKTRLTTLAITKGLRVISILNF